ncbi:MAG: hypothetical protein NTW19_18765 [Planctomycetota bacterium]|nr:hypothetical protein [Planctomycetota bacterium]
MSTSDPFALLGLPRRFDLDLAELQRRFIQASSANHPDRFTDPLDQADAADRSAAINEAHRALLDPQSRAEALLDLLAAQAKGAGAPAAPADAKALPPNLLMEMMEAREKMEEAEASGDQPALAELAAWARRERDERLVALGAALTQAAALPINDHARLGAALQSARLELNAIRYFRRMIDQSPETRDDR